MSKRIFTKLSKTMPKYLVVLSGILIGSTGLMSTPVIAGDKTATDLIFSAPYIKQLNHPAKINYHYKHDTPTPEEYGAIFEERVSVNVKEPTLEGGFNSVSISLKSEDRDSELGPFENTSGNPVVMMFLERELTQMRSKVGGTPVYFRNTIRRAFRDSALVEQSEVTLKGEKIPASKIVIKPFIDEQNIGRFGKYRGKVFEITVADKVPGGIFEMRSFIPGEKADDASLMTNELKYQEPDAQ